MTLVLHVSMWASHTSMPCIAFHSLLDEAVQVGLAALTPKVGGGGQNAGPPPLVTPVAAPLNGPAAPQTEHHHFATDM